MQLPVKRDQLVLMTALALVIGAYMAIDHPSAAQRVPFVVEINQPHPPVTQVAFTRLGR